MNHEKSLDAPYYFFRYTQLIFHTVSNLNVQLKTLSIELTVNLQARFWADPTLNQQMRPTYNFDNLLVALRYTPARTAVVS